MPLSEYHMGKHREGSRNNNGYTLLEAVIAMALFLVVLVPLLQRMSLANKEYRAKEIIIASCLLEQEAAAIMLQPDTHVATKRRMVQGKEWIIEISVQGDALRQYELKARYRGKEIHRILFYCNLL